MTASRFFHIQREHPEWLERSQLTAIDDFYLAVCTAFPLACLLGALRCGTPELRRLTMYQVSCCWAESLPLLLIPNLIQALTALQS